MNIPNAFTVLSDVIKDSELNNREKRLLIEDFDKVLSLDLLTIDKEDTSDVDEELVNQLINERNEVRKNKNWARADEIRKQLSEMNIELIDTKEGTTWKLR
jgi:cysteinyl-tRNA synthetase